MSFPAASTKSGLTSFRTNLLLAMMLVVSALTLLGLYVVERNAAAETEHALQRDFESELDSLHRVREVRHAALAERCRALVRRPRIHAALEDNALDLLYPSAKDELRDIMAREEAPSTGHPGQTLHARFYRFLDATGAVISPSHPKDVGVLTSTDEAQLALPHLPETQQVGYLHRSAGDGSTSVDEIIAMPIISHETGEGLAALALGFKPFEFGSVRQERGMKSGIWIDGKLHLPAFIGPDQTVLQEEIGQAIAAPQSSGNRFKVEVASQPYLLFLKRLNPDSIFPPAYEICLYPLADLLARQQRLRWEVLGGGALLLVVGFAASHFVSRKLSVPVEKLVVDSEEQRAQRERVEAALEVTHEELQRSARFSADASHQLKTPVTVLRAGLEELLASDKLSSEQIEEISALVHQTYRLASIIEDLLLLSRMDAGRLEIDFRPVNITRLVEGWLDDLSTLPDSYDLQVETALPAALHVAGETRYTTLIVQNLLENARRYNKPGGSIRITARQNGDWVDLVVANTGTPIASDAREHIFERFHRGTIGENVRGYGLGLNLARELARLHGGDLLLARSDSDWTEFEVRFKLATRPQTTTVVAA